MNLKQTILLFLILLSKIFISCKKPEPSTPQSSSLNYFPYSINSFWQYVYDNGSTEYDYIPGDTITANGKIFTYVKETITQNGQNNSDYGYICMVNGTYYGIIGLFGTSLAVPGYIGDRVFIDGSKVGDFWVDSIRSIGAKGELYWKYYTTVVKDVGISMVIQNVTYSNIVHFTLTVQEDQAQDSETIDFYVANGVGIIKEMEFDNANGKSYTKELTSYSIK